jgi:hypothetical protein
MNHKAAALIVIGAGWFPMLGAPAAADQQPPPRVEPVETLELEVGAILVRRPLAPLEADAAVDSAARPRAIVSGETFDRFLFGSTASSGAGRASLHALLARRIDELDCARRLTPAQRRKLTLAGRGDIAHLFDRIESQRRTFETIRKSGDLDACERFFAGLLPLRRTLPRGPFGPDSLLAKTLRKMQVEG